MSRKHKTTLPLTKGFNAIWLLVFVAIFILIINFAVFFTPPKSPVSDTEYGTIIEYPSSTTDGLNFNWFNVRRDKSENNNPSTDPNQNPHMITPPPTPTPNEEPYIPPHNPVQPSPSPTVTTGYCGDKVCRGNESCNNCSVDCGICNTPTPQPTIPPVSIPTATLPPAVYSQ